MHTKNDTIFFEINVFLQRFQTSVTKRHEIEQKKTKTNHNTTPKRYFWKEAKKTNDRDYDTITRIGENQ